MANDAHIFFAGYVATDPIYWQNRDGNSKATLRVAYTPRHIDRSSGEWTDSPTSFVTVTCWRKLADNVALCLRKGEPVLVSGRLQVRRYDDKEGRSQISVDVDAQSIGHDLARGVALFQRTRRVIGDTAAGMAGSDVAAPAGAGPDPGEAADGEAAGTAADAADAAGRQGPGDGPGQRKAGASGAPTRSASRPPGPDDDDELDESDDVLDDSAVAALLQGSSSAVPADRDGLAGSRDPVDGGEAKAT